MTRAGERDCNLTRAAKWLNGVYLCRIETTMIGRVRTNIPENATKKFEFHYSSLNMISKESHCSSDAVYA